MLHSIRWRLIVSYTLLTLLTVTLLGVTVLSLLQRYIDQQEEAHLQVNAEALARQAESLMAWKVPDMRLLDLAHTAAILGDFQVRILDKKEHIIADSGDPEALQQFSWFVPKLNALAIDTLPPGHVMVWQDGSVASQLPPLPPAKLSDAILLSDTVDSAVTIVRQSPSLWGPIIEFAVISKEKSLKEANQSFGVIASAKELGAGGVALASSVTLTHDLLITQTIASVRSTKVVSTPIENPIGVLGYVELSHAPSFGSEALAAVWRLFAWAAAGVSLLAVAFGLFVGRGLTAPLQELRRVTAKMNTGNLATRASIRGQDEIAGLAHDFNQMAAALEESFASLAAERDALRRFIADASHELRTPITALRSFNELLLGAAEEDSSARHEFLQEGQIQISRLERITDSLLNLSRLEGGLVALQCDDHELAPLIRNVSNNFKRIAQEREIMLLTNLPQAAITLHCDSQQLECALSNLVDNALKFTPTGGQVEIGAAVDDAEIEQTAVKLWVKDNGVGMAEDEIPLIFDRFHRGKNAAYTGSGLGLAIVKRIIDMHKGTIHVASGPAFGTCFTIRLNHRLAQREANGYESSRTPEGIVDP